MKILNKINMFLVFLVGVSFFGGGCSVGKKERAEKTKFTKANLLEGCEVPERRSYPLSKKEKPCENFHRYVCSEVEDSFELPKDRSRWMFAFGDASERLLCAKKKYFHLLKEGAEPKSHRLKPAKNFYLSCMDQEASKKEEEAIVGNGLKELDSIKDRNSLLVHLGSLIDQPMGGLVYFFTPPNQKDPNIYDLSFYPRLSYLPERSYSEKAEVVGDLKAVAKAFFEAMGREDSDQRAQWVVDFEKKMQQELPLPAEIRDRYANDTYVPRKQLLVYKNLRLGEFLKRVPKNTKIRNLTPEAFGFIDKWLASEDLEKIKAIYAFYTLSDYMDDAFPEYFGKAFEFSKKHLGGPEVRPSREERCTKKVMFAYDKELDEELISVLFPDFPEKRVVDLAERVRKSLLDSLERNTWLSEQGRNEAKKKMAQAKLNLMKPRTEEDWDFLPVLNLSSTTPYKNAQDIQKAVLEKRIRRLSEGRSRTQWGMGPLTVNAFYTPADNKFVLLQGILQYPFFDSSYSTIENLAAIGTVVGHELGHGIDDKGSKYDSEGKMRQWLTDNDIKEFHKRGEVFVSRFDKIDHIGELTLGENIGDHVGLTSSYKAAFNSKADASREDKKKFFEAYARIWCEVMRPGVRQRRLKTGPHALGFARINEQVIHLDGFYEAYQCTEGDKMYVKPTDRIRIW
jgi:putative endopeptidase